MEWHLLGQLKVWRLWKIPHSSVGVRWDCKDGRIYENNHNCRCCFLWFLLTLTKMSKLQFLGFKEQPYSNGCQHFWDSLPHFFFPKCPYKLKYFWFTYLFIYSLVYYYLFVYGVKSVTGELHIKVYYYKTPEASYLYFQKYIHFFSYRVVNVRIKAYTNDFY